VQEVRRSVGETCAGSSRLEETNARIRRPSTASRRDVRELNDTLSDLRLAPAPERHPRDREKQPSAHHRNGALSAAPSSGTKKEQK